MTTDDLIKEGIELFNAKKYTEAIQKLNEAWHSISDKTNNLQQQNDVQFWLGRCYLEQAVQTKNIALFEKAREHFQQRLALTKKFNGENGIEQQNYALSWLGYNYFQQAIQTRDAVLFKKAREHLQLQLELAKQLHGEKGILRQGEGQSGLGRCYLEQAIQTKKDATLFNQAREHFQETLKLAKKLGEDNGTQLQVYSQNWLGYCYLQQAKQEDTPDKEKIEQSRKHLNQALKLLNERNNSASLEDELEPSIKRRLRELDFLSNNYQDYFNSKQQYIQGQLPEHLDGRLKENLAAVLAVLSISPIEFDKPLAHYTSPTVCEKLLGIGQKQENQEKIAVSKMRMNSSTYMNDPYEGRSLSDFLGIHEAALENLTECSPLNAFFACFSARVNDLNQFRLYGKVGNTEASGCCLVFNKNSDWIQEPDIAASYRRLNPSGLDGNNIKKVAEIQMPSENLPLYQIAYIFYREEYTQHDEYDVMSTDENFGVRLKPISDNHKWHKVRAKRLQTALNHLREYFKAPVQNKEKSQENKAALEYIRYLFKDYAFRDEEEFRLLKIEETGSDKVQYCHITNTAFLEYGDICGRLDEVILGTNYERTDAGLKVEVFRHLLKRKNLNIKVSHSSLPINPVGR
ncbi:tetratricopeptide repeat protein [Neisseria sp.]|uniref:tetratricopeptide repeat protein n=1 Tax=Neisseria sp. TaxID=192066 RepID=UPI0035A18DA0